MGISVSALISAHQLHSLEDAVIIDASWHMPSSMRDAALEFAAAHIPGAVFFDLDAVSDKASPYPHMLPPAEAFEQAMRALGVSRDSDVVVYDSMGLFSAPRLWWMLRVFGHERVKVLDGGLPVWKATYTCEQGGVVPLAGDFKAEYRARLVATKEEAGRAVQLCDARSAARFAGAEPEPREGVKSGHIPGAHNVHYASLLEQGQLRTKDELRALFAQAGIALGEPIVMSCGSGVTACILALALYELGYEDVPVYDGSWAEWGSLDLPVAVGE